MFYLRYYVTQSNAHRLYVYSGENESGLLGFIDLTVQ